eukprot:9495496-Pyramimonas_sp.AAC.3
MFTVHEHWMAEAVCRMLSVHLSPVGVAYIVNPAAKSRAGVEEFQRWVVTILGKVELDQRGYGTTMETRCDLYVGMQSDTQRETTLDASMHASQHYNRIQ